MNLPALLNSLRCSLLHIESRLLWAAGIERQLVPALEVNGSSPLPFIDEQQQKDGQWLERPPGVLDSILWMAAPKKRRTIEVNRTRRRAEPKLVKVKLNIEPCPECGHLKQKHILCGFCYAKVCKETGRIRNQIQAMEGGPLGAPSVETIVVYADEKPSEADQGKRIVEMPRKRPSWFGH